MKNAVRRLRPRTALKKQAISKIADALNLQNYLAPALALSDCAAGIQLPVVKLFRAAGKIGTSRVGLSVRQFLQRRMRRTSPGCLRESRTSASVEPQFGHGMPTGSSWMLIYFRPALSSERLFGGRAAFFTSPAFASITPRSLAATMQPTTQSNQ